jgi:UrcA family protein
MTPFTRTLIAALVLSGAQAAAADSVTVESDARSYQLSTTVSYAGLDLESPRGVETLHRRLRHAAEQVCEPLKSRQASLLREYRQCRADALSRAVVGVDRPMLTQYHMQKTGQDLPAVANR